MIPRDGFFYLTLTRIMDSISYSPLFYLYIYSFFFFFFEKRLPEVPECAFKMQFHMMTLLDVLGKIAWVR